METRNLSPFREFIKINHKYALMYSNSTSQFAEQDFRADAFKIKSDLAHDITKDEQLYMSLNLPRAVTRIYTDYVIGLGYNVDFGDKKLNKLFTEISDKIQLQIKLNEAVDNQSSIGYWLLRLRNKNEKPRVEVIPLPNYLANMDGLTIGDTFEDIKEHFIFSVQKDRDGTSYFYVDRYEKLENGKWMGYYWEKRANNGSFIFSDRLEEGEEEELEDLPLFIFNNDLCNPHIVEDKNNKLINRGDVGEIPRYFHQSDYRDLADLFQELNDRTSQISVEFIKNLTSKMSVPASFKDAQTMQALKNGSNTKFSKNPDYLVHNVGENPAQYITKDTGLVNVAINDYIPTLLKFIGFIASIPPVLLTNAILGGNNPVGTAEKEFLPFYKRIAAKQQMMYSSLQRLFKGIMEIAGHSVDLPTIKFVKPANYDVAERTQTAVMQINAGIMSKESAIAYTMGYDQTEVQEELDKINKEVVDAYAQNNTNIVYEDEDKEDLDGNLDENKDGEDADK